MYLHEHIKMINLSNDMFGNYNIKKIDYLYFVFFYVGHAFVIILLKKKNKKATGKKERQEKEKKYCEIHGESGL